VKPFNKPTPRWLAIDLAVLRTFLPDSLMVFGSSAESCSSGFIPGWLFGSGVAALLGGNFLFPGVNALGVVFPVGLGLALLFLSTTPGVFIPGDV